MTLFRVLALVLALPVGGEAPILHIHAASRLEIDAAHRSADGILLGGRLTDDDTGEPIAHRPIELDVEDLLGPRIKWHEYTLTGEQGQFLTQLSVPVGHYRLSARYSGDNIHDSSHATEEVDFARRPLDLRFEGPARLVRGELARFRLLATSDGVPVDVPVRVGGAPRR